MNQGLDTHGIRRYVHRAMPEPEVYAINNGRVAAFSLPSPERQDAAGNEDAALVAEDRGQASLLCVADGAGGMRNGDIASRLAIEAMGEAWSARDADRDPRETIFAGFDLAHRVITQQSPGSATTLAGVAIVGRRVCAFHAGDSQVLIMGQMGRRKHLSIPHSPVGYGVEAGLIDEQAALHDDRLHVVSNLIGVGGARIEVSSWIDLAARDTVLIASDGLFDNLRVDEVIALARVGSLGQAATRLMAAARTRMTQPTAGHPSKPDDLALLLFRPTPPAPPQLDPPAPAA